MINQKTKTCDLCDDGNGECVYPYYGLAPHIHTKPMDRTLFFDMPIPENFSSDEDGLGVYTHCLNCGGDGTLEGVVLESKVDRNPANPLYYYPSTITALIEEN